MARSIHRSAWAFVVLWLLVPAFPALGQQQKFTLDIDAVKGTEDPADPVVHSAGDEFLTIHILSDGVTPAEDKARLRFSSPIIEVVPSSDFKSVSAKLKAKGALDDEYTVLGTQHSVSFRPCSSKELRKLQLADKYSTDQCPLIVRRGQAIVVVANTDVIPVTAEVDQCTGSCPDPFKAANVRKKLSSIRTVRPYWNLNWSAGITFFPGVRDEQYELSAIANNTEDQRLQRVDDGEVPYELAAFATYILNRPKRLPLGLTFGVSTKIPSSDLTALVGISGRIRPFPITDSAFVTVGLAYTGRNRLRAQYRDDDKIPVGLTEANILQVEKDLGIFVAFSFGFAGGKDEFTKVVAGK